jgi:hypothetical protein
MASQGKEARQRQVDQAMRAPLLINQLAEAAAE